ncbi:hypothetical protein [Nocardiopsis trehalosi]|uniref:hypothetical protein n=1 Tax=Nocardiopsis trehalosi TaxID=109329 RepID=UPI001FDF3381|nr:hypothetical protein [Nocardiopsis trehalosi]
MSPETYWRRRVFVLAGLLAVVAVIALSCSRLSSSGDEQSASGPPEASASPSSSPSVAPSPSPGDSPGPSGDDAEEDDPAEAGAGGPGAGGDGAGGSGSAGGDGGGAADVPAPQEAGDPCRPQDVVVTVDTDRSDYAWDAEPELEVTAVNTADQTCTVDVGFSAMEVRITSGDDRVFSTADCVEGDDSDEVELRRGVPHTATYTWDRTRSWRDCRDTQATADRPGTYVATLYGDYTSGAEPAVFRLN